MTGVMMKPFDERQTGIWKGLKNIETTRCNYVNEITKLYEHIKKEIIPPVLSNIIERYVILFYDDVFFRGFLIVFDCLKLDKIYDDPREDVTALLTGIFDRDFHVEIYSYYFDDGDKLGFNIIFGE